MCVLYNIYVQYIYIYEQLYTVSAKQSLHVCMYIYIYICEWSVGMKIL